MATKKREQPEGRTPPTKPGRRPPDDTVVRPEPPKCVCETTTNIYTQIGSLPPVGGRPLRIHVTVQSIVVCDPGTPEHCYYKYIATAEVQRFNPRRGGRPATWVTYRQRRAFIESFKVHDDVNKTETPDRIDQSSLTLGEWFPKAPQKEKTRITLKLAGSIRNGWRTEINRNLEVCVPKLDNPQCPES